MISVIIIKIRSKLNECIIKSDATLMKFGEKTYIHFKRYMFGNQAQTHFYRGGIESKLDRPDLNLHLTVTSAIKHKYWWGIGK